MSKRQGDQSLNGDDSKKLKSDDNSNTNGQQQQQQSKPPCPYGDQCYRKNPQHFIDCAHNSNHPMIANGAIPGAAILTRGQEKQRAPVSPTPVDPNARLTRAQAKNMEPIVEKPATSNWKFLDTVLVSPHPKVPNSKKLAAFDIDDTIITTKSGRTFATSALDWKLWTPNIASTLLTYHNQGFKIVFFSNQNGIGKGHTTKESFIQKMDKVCDELKVPIQIFASTEGGRYRKPAIGMFELYEQHGNGGVKVDVTNSIYVGDASGRAKNWAPGKKRDFSDSDRKFAMNLKMPFQTPEEFFLGEAPIPFTLEGCDPLTMKRNINQPLYSPSSTQLISPRQEIVIMVGYPGSGKSYFTINQLEQKGGYVRVNRDTLKTKEKCIELAQQSINSGKSVVIDNTNPDRDARKPYIQMAKQKGIQVRAFVMQTTYEESMHNNQFREIISNGKNSHVPTIVYNVYRKKFEEPARNEGFDEIVKTYFKPTFDDEEKEKIFYMWTPL